MDIPYPTVACSTEYISNFHNKSASIPCFKDREKKAYFIFIYLKNRRSRLIDGENSR